MPQANELAPHEAGTTVRRPPPGLHVNTAPRGVWKAAVSPIGAHTSCPFVSVGPPTMRPPTDTSFPLPLTPGGPDT